MNKNFRKNLRNLIYNRNCTYDDIARSLGVAKSTVGFWASGTTMPSGTNLQKLADYFCVTPSILLNGESKNATMSMDEERVLRMFRALSKQSKEKALSILREMMHSDWIKRT